ncbi:GCN5 family acetyltransferase [Actinoplanes sp. SE50]|uniref:GNAT family N-acetyltransferase n=1 Tax=unclassified Actinoplanes TaxID=2626549 RepID=UPI00023ED4D5|nr:MULTISPECIES: GNAT family N-acetyltransferase [unclassified Actinoplanes]AEV87314.1 GCN5-related N-acetyltransferase [Actinoplanes sp. SE50/110]ATO85714.1 GCN5 family acetyltransferase [Actinoplanes sp. SE50]SLM03127.1 GCN5 family acetyltransferase [Actinoplanes sp. SE50/110]
MDLFVRWAAAADGARIWQRPGATVVACAGLAHWDRLVVHGDPEPLAALVREVLPEVGVTFRPFGPEDLVAAVVARAPELAVSARFAWMEITEPIGRRPRHDPRWLTEDEWPEVSALLAESFPDSYAVPGGPGVRRWAGIRDATGRLVAVAADAWSTTETGFLAGVTTRPDLRGRGLAADLCGFAADELLAGRDATTGRRRVALLADYHNTAAVATYTGLGFAIRKVAAARQL